MTRVEDDDPPVIQVVRGAPTAEEVAAIVVVLSALDSPDAPAAPTPTTASGWGAHWRGLRTTLRTGPDGWRLSARRGAG